MKTNEVYDVDGCKDFIPVIIDGILDDGVAVTVSDGKQDYKLVVEEVYRFHKVHEPQKPVIPKFVAEWIAEAEKIHNNLSWIWFANPVSDELNAWLKNHTETFMRAWLDGYEIEKEKLYTVEIPNPHSYIDNHTRLARNYKGKVVLEVQDWLNIEESYKLTESEIKEDFEWAWQWAEPVEDK